MLYSASFSGRLWEYVSRKQNFEGSMAGRVEITVPLGCVLDTFHLIKE